MSLAIVTCLCGGSNSLVRNFLKSIGYPDWFDVPIAQGRDKSLSVLNQLPAAPEKDMLRSFLKDASKWAVIIGYNDQAVRWSDIAHNSAKSRIEAEFVVRHFA